ncbi:MAG: EamA family transporter [Candidatus Omnitrophica bacterium]|jgi:drug/metabolite transporter (DMT)-like permease|nr:EamA family transporter [Candidatus Omnitrophota bacterium]
MFRKRLTLKILLFLILSDILETFIQFCFKKSTIPVTGVSVTNLADAFAFIKTVSVSPFLWLGICTVLVIFVIWSTILSKIDLSVAVPVASFSYILVPLCSIIFLKETISPLRWVGIFFILSGILLTSLSSKEKINES